jgi:cupin 2 domain-containing protein
MSNSNSVITGNLFAALPSPHDGEAFEEILRCRNVRIERIVSSARPDPTLYDQPQDEWVCLLQGEAELWVAGQGLHLKPGDHCFIPARHSAPRCAHIAGTALHLAGQSISTPEGLSAPPAPGEDAAAGQRSGGDALGWR